MKKLLLFILLGMFMISFCSALEIDNTFTYDSIEDKIIFKNRLGIELIGGGVVAEAQLTENVCKDGRFCKATKTITLYEDGELIQDFKTLRVDDESWEEQDIRWHRLEYWGDISDYENQKVREEEVCNEVLNITECYMQDIYQQIKVGSHKGWIEFNEGDIFETGAYEVKTSGEIKPGRTYDWQVKINGDWTTPWAMWGNISLGDDAEVILNSPADDSISYTNEVTFNATANITGGATLINMSLWTNSSGNWEVMNTTDLTSDNYVYSSTFFDANDRPNPVGITWDGTNFWIVYSGEADVYKYTSSGSFVSSFDTSSEDTSPVGIIYDGTNLWLLGHNTDTAYEYTLAGAYTSNSFSISSDATGGTFNGTNFFIADESTDRVYKYTSSGGSLGFSTVINAPTGITWDGTNFWILSTTETVHQYDLSLTSTGISFSMSSQDAGMQELTIKDNNIWSVGTANDRAYKYILDTTSFSTQTWIETITDTTLWNVQACDSDGDCGFATSNYTIFLDSQAPAISVESPVGILDYNYVGNNEVLNVTFTDTNLDSCWYNYNGTNISIDGCLTGVKNSTQFILESGNTDMTIYTNDSVGNLNSTYINWGYNVLELNTIFEDTIFETQTGNYNLHFTTNKTTLANPKLVFNGVDNTAILIDNGDGTYNISATRTALIADPVDSSFHFEIDVASTTSTREINQTINDITLTNCSEGNSSSYLHLDFQDELSLISINASVSSSVWTFWIDDPSISKTFLFTNTGEESSYDFCFTPSTETYTLDIEFPYLATGYPQRIFRADDIVLTNSTFNRTLFLLGADDGFFTRYATINSLTGSIESGVEVTVQKDISGTPTTISQGITDDTGLTTLWLNPNDLHSFTFIKETFNVNTFDIRPSSPDTYTVSMIPTQLGEGEGNGTEIVKNLFYEIFPTRLTLEPNTNYVFSFNVSRSIDPVDSFSMTLSSNGTTIFSDTNLGNGIITTIINSSNNISIFGSYAINLENETMLLSKTWSIINIIQGEFSLDAWMEFGNELSFNSLWWNLFRFIVIFSVLLTVAYGFYYVDPFDSSISSLVAAIVTVWLFGTFGWLTIDTPLGSSIDESIIPALFSLIIISFMVWRYKSQ